MNDALQNLAAAISQPDQRWRDDAVCAQVDPELFFPPRGGVMRHRRAKAICMACPARIPCLEYAMSDPTLVGIWGGTSERDRAAARAGRADPAA